MPVEPVVDLAGILFALWLVLTPGHPRVAIVSGVIALAYIWYRPSNVRGRAEKIQNRGDTSVD